MRDFMTANQKTEAILTTFLFFMKIQTYQRRPVAGLNVVMIGRTREKKNQYDIERLKNNVHISEFIA